MTHIKLKVGQTVYALQKITESGESDDPYIHAMPGDQGRVVYVDVYGNPTVRFTPTGTATVVIEGEVSLPN